MREIFLFRRKIKSKRNFRSKSATFHVQGSSPKSDPIALYLKIFNVCPKYENTWNFKNYSTISFTHAIFVRFFRKLDTFSKFPILNCYEKLSFSPILAFVWYDWPRPNGSTRPPPSSTTIRALNPLGIFLPYSENLANIWLYPRVSLPLKARSQNDHMGLIPSVGMGEGGWWLKLYFEVSLHGRSWDRPWSALNSDSWSPCPTFKPLSMNSLLWGGQYLICQFLYLIGWNIKA